MEVPTLLGPSLDHNVWNMRGEESSTAPTLPFGGQGISSARKWQVASILLRALSCSEPSRTQRDSHGLSVPGTPRTTWMSQKGRQLSPSCECLRPVLPDLRGWVPTVNGVLRALTLARGCVCKHRDFQPTGSNHKGALGQLCHCPVGVQSSQGLTHAAASWCPLLAKAPVQG